MERYGAYVAQAHAWRLTALLSLTVAAISSAGVVWLGGQNQLVPYVVKVDKLGAAVAVDRADQAQRPDHSVIVAQLARWIVDVRNVYADAAAQRSLVTEGYAMVNQRGPAYGALNDHMRRHNPFERAKTETVSAEVQSVLPHLRRQLADRMARGDPRPGRQAGTGRSSIRPPSPSASTRRPTRRPSGSIRWASTSTASAGRNVCERKGGTRMKITLLIAGLLAAPAAALAQTATPAEPQGQAGASTTVEKTLPAKPDRPAAAPSGADKALKDKPAQPAKVETPPSPAPPFDPLGGVPNPPLTAKEKQGVAYGKQWKGNRDKPARGADGAVVYVFGATLPTIVCAPLYVCDLVLEAGEAVKSVNVGDSVRWQIAPAEQGAGEAQITHIIIKPTDVGLLTNMVITTDRRAYMIKLVSRAEDWMPRVSFEYPGEARASWSDYRAQRDREQEARAAAPVEPSGPLDFGYRLSGDQPVLAAGQGLHQRGQDLHPVPARGGPWRSARAGGHRRRQQLSWPGDARSTGPRPSWSTTAWSTATASRSTRC